MLKNKLKELFMDVIKAIWVELLAVIIDQLIVWRGGKENEEKKQI